MLTVLGVALVALFVLGELLFVRSYEKTSRTTRDFQRSTRVSAGLANAQLEALLLPGRCGVEGRRSDAAGARAPRVAGAPALRRGPCRARRAGQAHLRTIRADLERFDVLFATAYGTGLGCGGGPVETAWRRADPVGARHQAHLRRRGGLPLRRAQRAARRTPSDQRLSSCSAPSRCSWPPGSPSSSGPRSAATSPTPRACSRAPRRASSSSSSSSRPSSTRSRSPKTAARRPRST